MMVKPAAIIAFAAVAAAGHTFARMSGMLDLSRDEKATMSDGPDGDCGYVLCERPCAFGKA